MRSDDTSHDARYLSVILTPLAVCKGYKPKFGHGRKSGLEMAEFRELYGADDFYSWFGLDSPLVYAAHKAAGGITSVYRQIGIACERLFSFLLQEQLGLTPAQSRWSRNGCWVVARWWDEKGRPLRTYEARVNVGGGHRDMLFLDPRVEQRVGTYALYGWPCDGSWTVSGRYGVHGPTSKPRPLELGRSDLDVVMPETGIVQVQVQLPRPFPHGCLEAAYRHLESGEVVRWPVMDDTTNHRLRVGRYVATIELPGEALLELPPFELGHNQRDVPLALPDSLRVFRITVEDEQGNLIPSATGLVAGPAERTYHNDAVVGGMLVATARPSVDLTITSPGYVPVHLRDIDGDRRVVLEHQE